MSIGPDTPPGSERLLRPWRWAAVALLGPLLALAVLLYWPHGGVHTWQLLSGWAALVLVLGGCVALLLRLTGAALETARAAVARQQALIDALPNGMVLWGPDGGLVMANHDFRRLYAGFADAIHPGCRLDELLRRALAHGVVPEALGREAEWLTERLQAHQQADGCPQLRQMPGGRWREIRETRLPDGSVLGFSVDVTEHVVREQALQAAQRETELARQRLEDAVDALPAGFELYDADDRLLLVNRPMQAMYPLIADLAGQHPSFEQVVRTHHARGGLAMPAEALDGYLAERRAERRSGPASRLVRLTDGRWIRSHEQPTREGGVVGVRIDVTELVEQRAAAEAARADAELARQRLEDAIEALPAGFELFDAQDRLVLWNTRLREMYPKLADLIPQRLSFEALVRANHARGGLKMSQGELDAWLARRLAERRSGQEGRTLQVFDGRWVRAHERTTREGGVVAVRIDVTEYVEQKAAADTARIEAEQARVRLEDAIEALPDAFALYDAADRLVLCNSRYRATYALSAPFIRIGETFETMLRRGLERGQYPQGIGREQAWLAERLRAHQDPKQPSIQELPGNRWLRVDERRTREGGIAGVRTDVTELVRRGQALQQLNEQLDALNAELRQLSETDALTGLFNRRVLDRRLVEEVARARRHDLPLALLAIDIDHFKRYNDRHGHPAGDAALQAVAVVLARQAQRPSDLAARTGGEEFVLLLPHTDAEQALTQAERLIRAVDEAALPHGDSPIAGHLTLSVGAALLRPGWDATALKAAADAALYAAKQAGRHRARLWSLDMPAPTSAATPLP